MNPNSNVIIERQIIIDALATIQKEWEEAADGKSLYEVSANVGMLLDDVVRSVGIESKELKIE
jgi:hypothetical protein